MTNAFPLAAALPLLTSRLAPDSEITEQRTYPTLLIVGESASSRFSLAHHLKRLGYRILEADSIPAAHRKLESVAIDAVLTELHVQPFGAIELCRDLRSRETTASLPILIVAPNEDLDSEIAAIEAGADAFFSASVRPDVLHARVKACLRRKSLSESTELPDALFFAIARSVEERDRSLASHCERLALMSAVMGLRLGLRADEIVTLQRGGYVHDIGKIALPDAVLLKAAPLNEREWEMMKTHPVRGEAICARARSLQAVLPLIRHHHERWDGCGYPDRLKGEEIPLLARILQMADIYDALTAERPYKRAYSPEEALAVIREETRKGWRDPNLLPILESSIPLFRSDSFLDLAPLSLGALAASLAG